MRVNVFAVAGVLLSINSFAQSVIGVIDLRQREGTDSADRNVMRALPIEVRPKPEPEVPGTARPPTEGSGSQLPASGGSDSSPPANQHYAPAPEPNQCLEEGSDITTAPVPNYDVITAINMHDYLPLLNTAEQQMWSTAPLCFFANIEGYYTAAASATPRTAPSAAASTTPPATSFASLLRRTYIIDVTAQCEASPNSACASPTPTSTLPPLSFSSLQSDFFASYIPSALVSAYGAPRHNWLSTATTVCSGLHKAGSVTATYVAKPVAAATTTAVALAPQPKAPSSGAHSGVMSWGPWPVSVAAAGFLGAWVVLLMS